MLPNGHRFHGAMLLSVLCATALPLAARASLGGAASSVAADQIRMKASHEAKPEGAYTVHEMTVPSGTVVREFESPVSGKVFAVAWRGPFMPDLQQLLGDHFSTFVDAASHRGMRRGSARVDQSDLVVRSGGHMRAFSGVAYLPGDIPEGVNVEDLR